MLESLFHPEQIPSLFQSVSKVKMKVGVLGAGCIGQFVGAHIVAAARGESSGQHRDKEKDDCLEKIEVVFVGRSVLRRTSAAGTLRCSDFRRPGLDLALSTASLTLSYDPMDVSSAGRGLTETSPKPNTNQIRPYTIQIQPCMNHMTAFRPCPLVREVEGLVLFGFGSVLGCYTHTTTTRGVQLRRGVCLSQVR